MNLQQSLEGYHFLNDILIESLSLETHSSAL